MTANQSNRFIVYELCHPEGQPFYVGKGGRRRPYVHLWSARRGDDSHKARVIRKIEREGNSVVVEIVLESDNHEAVIAEEVRRIADYRRAGIELTNKTAGGEGNVGWSPSPETRAKIALATAMAQMGRTLPAEWRAAISAGQRRRKRGPLSDEHKAKLSAATKGKPKGPVSEETRAKMSAAAKKRVREPFSDERRAKISAAKKAYWNRRKASAVEAA